MRDAVSIPKAKLLHPKIAAEVELIIDIIESKWPPTMAIRIVQGLRTFEEQDKLYQQGRTTKGPIVTKAKPGSSYHQYGLAIDYAILYDKDGNGSYETLSWDTTKDANANNIADWNEVERVFVEHGYSWGGDWRTFKDLPHVEKTFGYNWRDLLELYNNDKFIPATKYVNI